MVIHRLVFISRKSLLVFMLGFRAMMHHGVFLGVWENHFLLLLIAWEDFLYILLSHGLQEKPVIPGSRKHLAPVSIMTHLANSLH